MRRAKRVRFIDPVPDGSQSGRFEAASAPCNSTEAPSSNNPKTSEFAFFKKFREDSSLKHQSKLPARGNVQLKCSKGRSYGGGECSTATGHSRGAKDNNSTSNSSLFTENARPSKTESLLSSQLTGSRRSEQGKKNIVSSSFIKTIGRNDQEEDLEFSPLIKTPTSSGTDGFFLERATESVRSDSRYMDGDIFSKKRAKLQSWVAKTMFPGKDEILMGCDLISLLLNRLLPESFESNDSGALKSRQDEEETEYQSVFMPKSGYQLKETWTERALVKHEDPCFMDVGASSSWSNKFHESFLLEGPVESACFPAFECADQMVLGHQERDIEPCYFSNFDYKQSWNHNSAEAFVEANAKRYGTSGTFNPRRMTHEYEPVQEHSLNDDPCSSRHYRLDDTLPQKSSLFKAGSSTPCLNNYTNRFLLEYEKRESDCIAEAPSFGTWSGSMFGNSPAKCRSSDESNDDLGYLRFRTKPSDLFLDWDIDRLKEKETSPSTEVSTVANGLYLLPYLPMSSADDALQEFDTRSNPPLPSPCEFNIPAADTGFLLSPSHQCLLPQRSYYHELETPETAHPSPYLLLEGNEDEREQSSRVREICYHSPAVELIGPSQIQKLDWRDTDEEEMYVL